MFFDERNKLYYTAYPSLFGSVYLEMCTYLYQLLKVYLGKNI